MKNLPLILTAVTLNTIGQLCLKAGMVKIGEFQLSPQNLTRLLGCVLRNPFIEFGIFCYGLSLLFWLWTLSKVEVSVAYPMLSLGYIFSVFAGHLWFHEPLTLSKIAGVMVILVGVYLVSSS